MKRLEYRMCAGRTDDRADEWHALGSGLQALPRDAQLAEMGCQAVEAGAASSSRHGLLCSPYRFHQALVYTWLSCQSPVKASAQ